MWGLLAAVALGAALRFGALDFGRGVLHAQADEWATFATLRDLERGQLSPSLVLYGGGYFYPLALVMKAWAHAGGETLTAALERAPFTGQVVARGWSAFLATLTVWLTGLVAARVFGWTAAPIAAALLAAATLPVREAHFAKADSAAALAAVLLLLALVQHEPRRGRHAAAIGAAAGLAVATKWSLGLLPAAALALARPPGGPARGIDRRGLLAGGLVLVVVALALDPFWMTAPRTSWQYARSALASLSTTAWLPGGDTVAGPVPYHARLSLRFGCGLGWALLALPALGVGLVRGGEARLVAVAVLGQSLALASRPMVGPRFFLPVVPGLAVLIAGLLVTAVSRRVWSPRARAVTLGAATAVLLAEPLARSVVLVRLLGRTDTRALAATWIAAHVPTNARIVSWGGPRQPTDFGRPALGGRTVLKNLAPARWQQARADYLVWSAYPLAYSNRPLPPEASALPSLALFDPFDGPTDGPVLDPVDAFYLPLARFAGVVRPGPRIEVFRIAAGSP